MNIITQKMKCLFVFQGIPLEFVRELPDIVVTQPPTEDEHIIFECELSRPAREKVEWRKDGKPMPEKMPEHVHIVEEENGTRHRIIFDDVKEEDIGEYTIKAEDVISKGKMEMRSKSHLVQNIKCVDGKNHEVDFGH